MSTFRAIKWNKSLFTCCLVAVGTAVPHHVLAHWIQTWRTQRTAVKPEMSLLPPAWIIHVPVAGPGAWQPASHWVQELYQNAHLRTDFFGAPSWTDERDDLTDTKQSVLLFHEIYDGGLCLNPPQYLKYTHKYQIRLKNFSWNKNPGSFTH